MSNMTEIEEKIYKHVFRFNNVFILNEKQKEKLTKEIKELSVYTVRYIEILNTFKSKEHSFMEGFSSEECRNAIKNSNKDISKMQRKSSDYGEILTCKYSFNLLEELQHNPNLLIDRLKIIEEEENSLLEKLESNNSIDIQKELFLLGHHIKDLMFLVSLNEDYFVKIGCSDFYKYIFVLADAIEDKTNYIVRTFLRWAIESERGC